jgi:sec-independent protein translocase protein TatA
MAARFKSGTGTGRAMGGPLHKGNPDMGSIGFFELLVILAILALVFGANRLPDLGRSVGQAIRGFRDAARRDDEHPPR